MSKKTTEIRNSMILSDEELLIIQSALLVSPWIPTKGYQAYRALIARFDAEVLRRSAEASRGRP